MDARRARRTRIQTELSTLNRDTLERLYVAFLNSSMPDAGPGRELHEDYLLAVTVALRTLTN